MTSVRVRVNTQLGFAFACRTELLRRPMGPGSGKQRELIDALIGTTERDRVEGHQRRWHDGDVAFLDRINGDPTVK